MKSIFNKIISFLEAFGQARYAAFLARNGKWREAQEMYQK